MKPLMKVFVLLAALLLLVSCSKPSPTPQSAPVSTGNEVSAPVKSTPSPSPDPTAKPTAEPSPTPTPVPLPTTNITGGLPDPSLWQPSLKIDPKDYPRVDGSTANIPMGVYLRAKLTGMSLADCQMATSFRMTGPAWLALANKEADLLLVYEAPDEVKQQLDGMGAKLLKKNIGLDALVFLTNKGNKVKGLTHKQIINIYTGKITKWNQVGGDNIDIIPYQRVSNSGSQALMLKVVMKGTKMMEAPSILQPGEMSDLVDAVASYDNTNNALGYSVYYYVRNMYQVPGVKVLNVNGVTPNSETIASGKYPYVNPFYAVIREDEPADSPARKMFDWLTTDEGKKAIEEAGYVAAK